MAMVIAVTDACIFIDLIQLALLNRFFSLKMEIHTSIEVVNELYVEQQQELSVYIGKQQLIIHNLSQDDNVQVMNSKFPRGLSNADKSALWIAFRLGAILVSSDGLVRKTAKREGISCHGIIWVLDQMVEVKVLHPDDAVQKLNLLTQNNQMFQRNLKLEEATNERLERWGRMNK